MSTIATTSPDVMSPDAGDIVARPSKEYRIKRYVMVLLLLGGGAWFLRDGYVKYPATNLRIQQIQQRLGAIQTSTIGPEQQEAATLAAELAKLIPHNDLELFIQRAIGWTLPPLGVACLVWAIYNSRGEYRLRGDLLTVPGHPPVRIDEITAIDRTKWDKKGIAYLSYSSAGATGKIRLDDFIYERRPTDQIFDRAQAALKPQV